MKGKNVYTQKCLAWRSLWQRLLTVYPMSLAPSSLNSNFSVSSWCMATSLCRPPACPVPVRSTFLQLDVVMTQNHGQWTKDFTLIKQWAHTLCSFFLCFFFCPGVPMQLSSRYSCTIISTFTWMLEWCWPCDHSAQQPFSPSLPVFWFLLCVREMKVHLVKSLLFWVFWSLQPNQILINKACN
jgi:hypothetical protein